MQQEEKKNKGGRPPIPFEKAKKELPETYAQDIIDIYMDGGSDVEVRAYIIKKLGYSSVYLFYKWLEDSDEFSEIVNAGRELSLAWWENTGRTSLDRKYFNYNGWYMNMKNRYKWTDRTETKLEADVNQTQTIINLGNGESPEQK